MATAAVAINDLLATRLFLDGQWSLDEFELLFRSFNDLYRLIAAFTLPDGVVSDFVHVSSFPHLIVKVPILSFSILQRISLYRINDAYLYGSSNDGS